MNPSCEAATPVLAPVARPGGATVSTSLSRVAAIAYQAASRPYNLLGQLAPRSGDRGYERSRRFAARSGMSARCVLIRTQANDKSQEPELTAEPRVTADAHPDAAASNFVRDY